MIFFIRLSRLVTVYNNINKKLPSSHFLFILLQTVTKRLSRIKKSYIFIISVHCPTQRQVPPVLNSAFKFQTLTPSAHTPSDHLGDYLNQTLTLQSFVLMTSCSKTNPVGL